MEAQKYLTFLRSMRRQSAALPETCFNVEFNRLRSRLSDIRTRCLYQAAPITDVLLAYCKTLVAMYACTQNVLKVKVDGLIRFTYGLEHLRA